MVQGDQSMCQGIKLGGRVECLRNLGSGIQVAKEQIARSRWAGEEGLAGQRSRLVRALCRGQEKAIEGGKGG